MPIQKFCTVAEAVRLNEFACSLTLEAEGMEPQGPDQFVHVKCGHSRLLRRPISICDWGKNRLRIVFEVRREGTAWLARRKAGDTLDVLGPLGRGFLGLSHQIPLPYRLVIRKGVIAFIAEQHQGCYGCQGNKHSQNNQALPDYALVRLVHDFPAVLLFLEGTGGRYDLTLQLLFFIFTAH